MQNEFLRLSPRGLELLKNSEGLRLRVYRDIVGKITIGYGHLVREWESFPNGITMAVALEILARDIQDAEAAVKHLVTVQLTQGQFDALVDFVFNLGAQRLAGSTLLRLLNQGEYDAAAHELLKWDHAGHVEVAGLKARREAEYQLWKVAA